MKAKDTLLLNITITQNPILIRRAWFWHVASHICFLFTIDRIVIVVNCIFYNLSLTRIQVLYISNGYNTK